MSLSRRLRFEVLRRDGHTCRYCGASAPEVKLTVDHVIPVALGGGDEPSNLVTACADCNAGKSSSAPDAPIVEDVDAAALLFAKAAEKAAAIRRAELDDLTDTLDRFRLRWSELLGGVTGADYLPRDWPGSVERFLANGLAFDDLWHFINVTYDANLSWSGRFRYFCGCCWNEISRRQEMARRLIEDGEV